MKTVDEYVAALESALRSRAALERGDVESDSPIVAVERAQREGIPPRLLKGAEVIGRLWQSGLRCELGYSAFCRCAAPTAFCQAKTRFLGLLLDYAHMSAETMEVLLSTDPNGGAFLILNMTLRQFHRIETTVLIAAPPQLNAALSAQEKTACELPVIPIGPNGTSFETVWASFLCLVDSGATPEIILNAWVAVTRVNKALREPLSLPPNPTPDPAVPEFLVQLDALVASPAHQWIVRELRGLRATVAATGRITVDQRLWLEMRLNNPGVAGGFGPTTLMTEYLHLHEMRRRHLKEAEGNKDSEGYGGVA